VRMLLDEGMPLRAASLLREKGLDAHHVLELDLSGTSDEQLIRLAGESNAMICSLDSDFHRLLALGKLKRPSVIRVRIDGLNHIQMGDLLESVTQQCAPAIDRGAAVSVTEKQIRIRQLPI